MWCYAFVFVADFVLWFGLGAGIDRWMDGGIDGWIFRHGLYDCVLDYE